MGEGGGMRGGGGGETSIINIITSLRLFDYIVRFSFGSLVVQNLLRIHSNLKSTFRTNLIT
jgi:hypothetical protein